MEQQREDDYSPVVTFRDPWRCSCCKKLMYAIDKKGYPEEGAPMPKRYMDSGDLCSLCFRLRLIVDGGYWTDIQKKDIERRNRLSVGGDYKKDQGQ